MVTIAWEGTRTKRLRADNMFLQLFLESVKFWCGQKLDLGVLAEGYDTTLHCILLSARCLFLSLTVTEPVGMECGRLRPMLRAMAL